jgi:hypothetical protein
METGGDKWRYSMVSGSKFVHPVVRTAVVVKWRMETETVVMSVDCDCRHNLFIRDTTSRSIQAETETRI